MDKLLYRERLFLESIEPNFIKTKIRSKEVNMPLEWIEFPISTGIYVIYEIRERDDLSRYFEIKPDDD